MRRSLPVCFAGHSKWKNIQHRKGRMDKAKSVWANKFSREIRIAVQLGGGPDPSTNFRLDSVLRRAKAHNVGKHVIENALKAEAHEDKPLDEVTYEGGGPGGVMIIAEGVTDNHKRTAGEVRHIFSKYGGHLGSPGSAAFCFRRFGIVQIDLKSEKEEEKLIESGMCVDYTKQDAYCAVEDLAPFAKYLRDAGLEISNERFVQVPQSFVQVSDETTLHELDDLLFHLNENDDIISVFHNLLDE